MPPSQASVPHPPHLTPLVITELSSSCYIAASHWLFILHMVVYVCQCYSLSLFHPLFPTLCTQSNFYMGDFLIFGFFPKSFSSMELTPSFWQEAFQNYCTLSFKEVSSPSPNLSDSAPCTTVAVGNSLGGAWCIFPLWREKLPGPFYSKGF